METSLGEMQQFPRRQNKQEEPPRNHDDMGGKYDTLNSPLKHTTKTKILKIIKDDGPTETIQQLSTIPYPTYKELTNLELAYTTYYEEKAIQNSHNRHCPTCQNSFNSLTRLTIHRKHQNTH